MRGFCIKPLDDIKAHYSLCHITLHHDWKFLILAFEECSYVWNAADCCAVTFNCKNLDDCFSRFKNLNDLHS